MSDSPKLLSEWHPSKNGGLFPYALTMGSNKKVWWICDKGHEFDLVVNKRVAGQNCPYCSNKRVLIGYNDLKTLFPKLDAEFDNEDNDFRSCEVVIGSTRKAVWKCLVCNNKWRTEIRHRTQRDSGCPKCAQLIRTKNHQKTILSQRGCLDDPLLLKEWDFEKNAPLMPNDVTAGCNTRVNWICSKCGHNWVAVISNRANLGRGCPCCSNKVIVKGKNDLATTRPELAEEWHPDKNGSLTPFKVSYGCGKKVWWKCRLGHEYQATVLHRSHGTNCPICNSVRQTSFAEQAIFFYIKKIFPEAVNRYTGIFENQMELDIFIPSIKVAIEYDGVFYHSKTERHLKREKKKYEICQNNHIKLIRIKETILKSKPFELSADVVFHMDAMENTKELNMLIRHLLDELDPESNMWTRKKPLYFHSQVDVDVERDSFEIRKYMTKIDRSLADIRPDLVQEWHPEKNGTLTPEKVSVGSDIKVWWECTVCGYEWKTSIGHRVNGTGCKMCIEKKHREIPPLAKKIYQYKLSGEFVKEWKSLSEAGRQLSISNSNISMCARHQRKQAGGFRWEYHYVEKLS